MAGVSTCSSITCPQGFRVIVQSERHPDYLDSRIEAFLASLDQEVQQLTAEEFNTQVEALATTTATITTTTFHASVLTLLFQTLEIQVIVRIYPNQIVPSLHKLIAAELLLTHSEILCTLAG